MNREDIIRMARECGFWLDGANQAMPMWVIKQEELERFAVLVASAERDRMCEQFNLSKELAHEKAKSNEAN